MSIEGFIEQLVTLFPVISFLAAIVAVILIPRLYSNLSCDKILCKNCKYPINHTGYVCSECGKDVSVVGYFRPNSKLRWLLISHLLLVFVVVSSAGITLNKFLPHKIKWNWHAKLYEPVSSSYESIELVAEIWEWSIGPVYYAVHSKLPEKFTLTINENDTIQHVFALSSNSSNLEEINDWFDTLKLHENQLDRSKEALAISKYVELQLQPEKIERLHTETRTLSDPRPAFGKRELVNNAQEALTSIRVTLQIVFFVVGNLVGIVYCVRKYKYYTCRSEVV